MILLKPFSLQNAVRITKNESVLVNYAMSLFYESVSKSDCIIRAKNLRCRAPEAHSGVARANNLLEKTTA